MAGYTAAALGATGEPQGFFFVANLIEIRFHLIPGLVVAVCYDKIAWVVSVIIFVVADDFRLLSGGGGGGCHLGQMAQLVLDKVTQLGQD